MKVTDHEFRPSKRADSCDFTYWQRVGPWLVCDYPAADHEARTDVDDSFESHGHDYAVPKWK